MYNFVIKLQASLRNHHFNHLTNVLLSQFEFAVTQTTQRSAVSSRKLVDSEHTHKNTTVIDLEIQQVGVEGLRPNLSGSSSF